MAVIETKELIPGIVVETQLRLGSARWLEKQWGADLAEIDLTKGATEKLVDIVCALAQQANPDCKREAVVDALNQLPYADFMRLCTDVIAGAFGAANPTARTETLTES